MAARLYAKGKEHILNGDIDLLNDNIVAYLVTGEYAPDTATDESCSAIPLTAIVAEETLSGTTISDGVFDADDVTFTSVSGDPVAYIVLALDTPAFSTNWLIAIIDDATAFPLTLTGVDVAVQWSNAATKIFGL
jgi:hypothetical protein